MLDKIGLIAVGLMMFMNLCIWINGAIVIANASPLVLMLWLVSVITVGYCSYKKFVAE